MTADDALASHQQLARSGVDPHAIELRRFWPGWRPGAHAVRAHREGRAMDELGIVEIAEERIGLAQHRGQLMHIEATAKSAQSGGLLHEVCRRAQRLPGLAGVMGDREQALVKTLNKLRIRRRND